MFKYKRYLSIVLVITAIWMIRECPRNRFVDADIPKIPQVPRLAEYFPSEPETTLYYNIGADKSNTDVHKKVTVDKVIDEENKRTILCTETIYSSEIFKSRYIYEITNNEVKKTWISNEMGELFAEVLNTKWEPISEVILKFPPNQWVDLTNDGRDYSSSIMPTLNLRGVVYNNVITTKATEHSLEFQGISAKSYYVKNIGLIKNEVSSGKTVTPNYELIRVQFPE